MSSTRYVVVVMKRTKKGKYHMDLILIKACKQKCLKLNIKER